MQNKENSRLVGSDKAFVSRAWRSAAAAVLLVCGLAAAAGAATSNITATVHNLSKNSTKTVKATENTSTQICVFCHTPHAATAGAVPLWNRTINSAATYTKYTSSSLDATTVRDALNGTTSGSSLLCLSCHDGTIALGNVNVLNRGPASMIMTGTETDYTMPKGSYGEYTGYTRRLGKDLSNDHPISITYDNGLAKADGEMAIPDATTQDYSVTINSVTTRLIGLPKRGSPPPLFPLAPTGTDKVGQVQCATCHDPHITAEKFLRASRFQIGTPDGSAFNVNNDIICLACHTKLGDTWAKSAHANPIVADEEYVTDAATIRQFPTNQPVWKAACLNCHDTHTVSGSRRLLREGVGTTSSAYGGYQAGSAVVDPLDNNKVSSIENTCYQCHSPTANRVVGTKSGSTVPDIYTEFETRSVRMPIRTADQGGTSKKETHDILNADFIETDVNLGRGVPANRHVECTDCHNPHRVRRASTFYGISDTSGEGAKRTHNAGGTDANNGADGNVASGVLRGAWGVDPSFGTIAATWPQNPSFPAGAVKKGDPTGSSTLRSETYLTREYQLCFKCHSNYANSDTAANFPSLGNTLKGTATGTNSVSRYTNVAAEFGSVNAADPPETGRDQGEKGNTSTACRPYGGAAGTVDCDPTPSGPVQTNNHRSWHPVMWPTGRTPAERGSASFSNIRAPFNKAANIGLQTMHCSDCHGNAGAWTQDTGPNSNTQGPHGSDNNFLLKGNWTTYPTSGYNTPNAPGFCGNCHNPTGSTSGFAGATEASHNFEHKNDAGCTFCHIALPHGWKNKAFLVNLNCVGPENGETTGFDTLGCKTKTAAYTAGPYYVSAKLTITSWAISRGWGSSNCNGVTWMQDVCGSW